MADEEGFEVQTRRPGTAIVLALESGDTRAGALAELIVQGSDGEEGWVTHEPGCWWWFPARLAVQVRYSPPGPGAQVEARIHVVSGAALTDDLSRWLNYLNAHSLGWWWWFDDAQGDVYCSVRCCAEPMAWWWAFILSRVLPHAVTVSEAMAERLANAGLGTVATAAHPERGPRPRPDGWLLGVQLGPRDMSASLDPWIAESELSRLHAALASITGTDSHEVSAPFRVVIKDTEGEPIIAMRKHWHASWGWGWQLTTLTGIQAPGRRFGAEAGRLAASLNREQATSGGPANRFGGWVYDQDLGMTHVTFLPALLVDMLTSMAGPTIGDIAALMVDAPQRYADLDRIGRELDRIPLVPESIPQGIDSLLQSMTYRLGPIGWSYEICEAPAPASSIDDTSADSWAADQPDLAWNVPKHLPICGFGVFNPMGPTVSSLEVSLRASESGVGFALFHVMRHPHSPAVTLLGTGDDFDELGPLIQGSLAFRGPDSVLGGGPEWVDIWAHDQDVLDGLRAFAEEDGEADVRAIADELMNHALTPWARVSGADSAVSSAWGPDADPVDCWLAAITNYAVVTGQRLFMRSAWEGALSYRKSRWDAAVAQRAADAARNAASERLEADVASRR